MNIRDHISTEDPDEIFRLTEILATGAYGSVYKAVLVDSGQEVAVKIVSIEDDDALEELIVEIVVLERVAAHRNVVSYYGSYEKDDELFIVMELCAGGSTADLYTTLHRPFSELQIAVVMREALYGLQHMHEQLVIHRDVKAANILLTVDGAVKLVDFGVSAVLQSPNERRHSVIGTPLWMAPEVIDNTGLPRPYDERVDVWGLGITCLELAELEPPLNNVHPMGALMMIPTRPAPRLADETKWSPQFVDFVRRCCSKDPATRPRPAELLHHPFITTAASHGAELLIPLIEEHRTVELALMSSGSGASPVASIGGGTLSSVPETDTPPLPPTGAGPGELSADDSPPLPPSGLAAMPGSADNIMRRVLDDEDDTSEELPPVPGPTARTTSFGSTTLADFMASGSVDLSLGEKRNVSGRGGSAIGSDDESMDSSGSSSSLSTVRSMLELAHAEVPPRPPPAGLGFAAVSSSSSSEGVLPEPLPRRSSSRRKRKVSEPANAAHRDRTGDMSDPNRRVPSADTHVPLPSGGMIDDEENEDESSLPSPPRSARQTNEKTVAPVESLAAEQLSSSSTSGHVRLGHKAKASAKALSAEGSAPGSLVASGKRKKAASHKKPVDSESDSRLATRKQKARKRKSAHPPFVTKAPEPSAVTNPQSGEGKSAPARGTSPAANEPIASVKGAIAVAGGPVSLGEGSRSASLPVLTKADRAALERQRSALNITLSKRGSVRTTLTAQRNLSPNQMLANVVMRKMLKDLRRAREQQLKEEIKFRERQTAEMDSENKKAAGIIKDLGKQYAIKEREMSERIFPRELENARQAHAKSLSKLLKSQENQLKKIDRSRKSELEARWPDGCSQYIATASPNTASFNDSASTTTAAAAAGGNGPKEFSKTDQAADDVLTALLTVNPDKLPMPREYNNDRRKTKEWRTQVKLWKQRVEAARSGWIELQVQCELYDLEGELAEEVYRAKKNNVLAQFSLRSTHASRLSSLAAEREQRILSATITAMNKRHALEQAHLHQSFKFQREQQASRHRFEIDQLAKRLTSRQRAEEKALRKSPGLAVELECLRAQFLSEHQDASTNTRKALKQQLDAVIDKRVGELKAFQAMETSEQGKQLTKSHRYHDARIEAHQLAEMQGLMQRQARERAELQARSARAEAERVRELAGPQMDLLADRRKAILEVLRTHADEHRVHSEQVLLERQRRLASVMEADRLWCRQRRSAAAAVDDDLVSVAAAVVRVAAPSVVTLLGVDANPSLLSELSRDEGAMMRAYWRQRERLMTAFAAAGDRFNALLQTEPQEADVEFDAAASALKAASDAAVQAATDRAAEAVQKSAAAVAAFADVQELQRGLFDEQQVAQLGAIGAPSSSTAVSSGAPADDERHSSRPTSPTGPSNVSGGSPDGQPNELLSDGSPSEPQQSSSSLPSSSSWRRKLSSSFASLKLQSSHRVDQRHGSTDSSATHDHQSSSSPSPSPSPTVSSSQHAVAHTSATRARRLSVNDSKVSAQSAEPGGGGKWTTRSNDSSSRKRSASMNPQVPSGSLDSAEPFDESTHAFHKDGSSDAVRIVSRRSRRTQPVVGGSTTEPASRQPLPNELPPLRSMSESPNPPSLPRSRSCSSRSSNSISTGIGSSSGATDSSRDNGDSRDEPKRTDDQEHQHRHSLQRTNSETSVPNAVPPSMVNDGDFTVKSASGGVHPRADGTGSKHEAASTAGSHATANKSAGRRRYRRSRTGLSPRGSVDTDEGQPGPDQATRKRDSDHPRQPCFGVSLDELADRDHRRVPLVVSWMLGVLGDRRRWVIGLFRKPAPEATVQAVRDILEQRASDHARALGRSPGGDDATALPGTLNAERFTSPPELLATVDINAVALCLRRFLKELSDPLLPVDEFAELFEAVGDDDKFAEIARRLIKERLSLTKRDVLTSICRVLHQVTDDDGRTVTLMTPVAAATCLGPNIVRTATGGLNSIGPSGGPAAVDGDALAREMLALSMGNKIVERLIVLYEDVFGANLPPPPSPPMLSPKLSDSAARHGAGRPMHQFSDARLATGSESTAVSRARSSTERAPELPKPIAAVATAAGASGSRNSAYAGITSPGSRSSLAAHSSATDAADGQPSSGSSSKKSRASSSTGSSHHHSRKPDAKRKTKEFALQSISPKSRAHDTGSGLSKSAVLPGSAGGAGLSGGAAIRSNSANTAQGVAAALTSSASGLSKSSKKKDRDRRRGATPGSSLSGSTKHASSADAKGDVDRFWDQVLDDKPKSTSSTSSTSVSKKKDRNRSRKGPKG